MKLIPVITILICLVASTATAQWYTDSKVQFSWEYPATNFSYKVYIAPPYGYPATHFATTQNLSYTFLPTWDGTWILGVMPVNVDTGEEGTICWSDDSSCVLNGQPFQLWIKTNPQGTRWKVMWK